MNIGELVYTFLLRLSFQSQVRLNIQNGDFLRLLKIDKRFETALEITFETEMVAQKYLLSANI